MKLFQAFPGKSSQFRKRLKYMDACEHRPSWSPPDTLKNSSALAFSHEDITAATHYLETLSQLFPLRYLRNGKSKREENV
jgi:hypothetical protein